MKTNLFLLITTLIVFSLASCKPNGSKTKQPNKTKHIIAIARDVSGSISDSCKNDQITFVKSLLNNRLSDSMETQIYTSKIYEGQSLSNLKRIEFSPISNLSASNDQELTESEKLLDQLSKSQENEVLKNLTIREVIKDLFAQTEKANRSSILEYLPLLSELRNNAPDDNISAYIISDLVECSSGYRNMIANMPKSNSEASTYARKDLGKLKKVYALKEDALKGIKIFVLLPEAGNSEIKISPFIITYWQTITEGLGAEKISILR